MQSVFKVASYAIPNNITILNWITVYFRIMLQDLYSMILMFAQKED